MQAPILLLSGLQALVAKENPGIPGDVSVLASLRRRTQGDGTMSGMKQPGKSRMVGYGAMLRAQKTLATISNPPTRDEWNSLTDEQALAA